MKPAPAPFRSSGEFTSPEFPFGGRFSNFGVFCVPATRHLPLAATFGPVSNFHFPIPAFVIFEFRFSRLARYWPLLLRTLLESQLNFGEVRVFDPEL